MFDIVLLDYDLIDYLHMNDELLLERTNLRNVDFIYTKNMQQKIETSTLEIEEMKKIFYLKGVVVINEF